MSDPWPVARVRSGVFRRRIRLETRGDSVVGDLEDDFHRVHVVLRHDGAHVTACSGDTPRIPWTTCPAASTELRRFVGMPLSTSLPDARRHSNPRLHCTHLFDVASLAVTHAAAGRDLRNYAIEIPDDRGRATLRRDGAPLIDWALDGATILGPEPWSGRSLFRGGLADWAERNLEPDLCEATLLLHRALAIALGRSFDLDQVERASAFGRATGNCYSFQPERIEQARRNVGTSLDFSDRPDDLLRDRSRPSPSEP